MPRDPEGLALWREARESLGGPDLAVLVPVKPLAEAKSRLRNGLPDEERRAVVLAMLDRVLQAVKEAMERGRCNWDVYVLGADPVLGRLAKDAHAARLSEHGSDLNSSLGHAMAGCFGDGAAAVLYLPADLPLITADDIETVVSASEDLTQPAAVRAARDGGTNALLIPFPCSFEPALGPDSFEVHRQAAAAEGATLVQVHAPSIAFDVDTMDDLSWALDNIEGFADEVEAAKALFARHARSAH